MSDLPAAYDLTGRVALVTGAGSPDGIAWRARGCSAPSARGSRSLPRPGARTTAPAELAAAGVEALGVVADLTVPDEVAAAGGRRARRARAARVWSTTPG